MILDGNACYAEEDVECGALCNYDCPGHKISVQHHSTSNTYTISYDGEELYLSSEALTALIKCLQTIQK